MVFTKLLGIFDIVAAIFLILLHYEVNIPIRFVVVVALLLLFKAYAFKGCLISYLDGFIGIYMLIMLFGVSSIITWIAVIILAQKGIISLF